MQNKKGHMRLTSSSRNLAKLFSRLDNNGQNFVLVYVHEMLSIFNDKETEKLIKTELSKTKYCLGIDIDRIREKRICLSQYGYTRYILNKLACE